MFAQEGSFKLERVVIGKNVICIHLLIQMKKSQNMRKKTERRNKYVTYPQYNVRKMSLMAIIVINNVIFVIRACEWGLKKMNTHFRPPVLYSVGLVIGRRIVSTRSA